MYKYIFNSASTTPLDETWKTKISESLKNRHIASEFEPWSDEVELAKILQETSKTTTNSLVVIGNDQDFNSLIGVSSLVQDDIAIGFIPLDGGKTAKKLQLKSWETAIDALAQRRIQEIIAFSVGKRFFLESIEFGIAPTDNQQPLIVSIDSRLNLRLPECKLHFENLSEDRYHSKNPILFSAHSYHQQTEPSNDLLGGLRKKLKINLQPRHHNIANLHGKLFHIESASEITDNYGRSYKNSLWIGKNSRKLRLITGRQKQIN